MAPAEVVVEDRRITDDLQRYLRRAWPSSSAVVGTLRPFGDGNNGHTYSVEIDSSERQGRFVLRLSPPGLAIKGPTDVGRQGRIMAALHRAGLPSPEVLAAESAPSVDGRSFFLATVVEGTDWADRAAHTSHLQVATDAVDTLKALHRLPLDDTGIGGDAATGPVQEVERWDPLLARSPEIARGAGGKLRLELLGHLDRAAGSAAPVVVHGDYHYGNLLFGGRGVVAVLDWEIASIGHPLTDLACLAVASLRRRYTPDPNPTGDVDISLTALVEVFGADPEAAAWHIAASCLKYTSIIGYNLQLNRSGKRLEPIYNALEFTMVNLAGDGLAMLESGLDGF